MPSRDDRTCLDRANARLLIDVARRAIEHAVTTGTILAIEPSAYPECLRADGATFVTVERNGDLLGCIGTLTPRMSIVQDVANNAHGAVLHDPRCPILSPSDVTDLDLHISILSEPDPIEFDSEEDLVAQLRPGVDGLLLEERFHRGTFLPSVWESLPDPRDFVAHLKVKAGLPPTYWSPSIRVSRYTTDVVDSDA